MLQKIYYPFMIAIFVTSLTSHSEEIKNSKIVTSETLESDVIFDNVLLNVADPRQIDLSRFSKGSSVLPGTYTSEIYVNGEKIGSEQITFSMRSDRQVQPCLTRNTLKEISFNYSVLPGDFESKLKSPATCFYLSELVPQASILYDSGVQRLDISVPQAMMSTTARGSVSPELWDSGVPAAYLGYMVNGYTAHTHGEQSNSAYASINSGINLGEWYFRHNGYLNWAEEQSSHYESVNTYVQRDIPMIKGRVILGESNTLGQVFDTLPYRGVELVNDDRMLPQSLRGYAPDIRGIARTNAKVTVRQNNLVIYETVVSPGEFHIDDLYPTGYGGNLDVTVTESDGTTQNFQVPYASVTQLLRPGAHHYDVVAGELNDSSISKRYTLYQATYQRGLTNIVTGYGGMQASQDYYALQLGAAFSTPIGAVSTDVTQARTHLSQGEGDLTGQSYQVSYSKYINETNSNFSLAAYRFSTSGYLDFLTAMRARNAEDTGQNSENIWRPKNKFTVTANQGFPELWGQMYVTGYTQDYWNHGNSDLQYQMGYSNSVFTRFNTISYNISIGRVRSTYGDMETNFLFSINMPLGQREQKNVPQLTASLNRNSNGRTGEQVNISGTAGNDYEYSYGVSAINYNQGIGASGALNGQYRSPYTNVSGTFGTGKDYQSGSVGLSGTVLGYQEGIVMTPYTGDTFAIVEAKGASGARVGGYSGLKIDPWGHAAVPYLNPYEWNEISIDPKGLPYDVELQTTSQKTAPNAGAVVHLKFETQRGYPLLITASQEDGAPLPFGADVFDRLGNSVGTVGQMGQIYVRVQNKEDRLQVTWGKDSGQSCYLNYTLPAESNEEYKPPLARLHTTCGAKK